MRQFFGFGQLIGNPIDPVRLLTDLPGHAQP
jgi:hypothetical protein